YIRAETTLCLRTIAAVAWRSRSTPSCRPDTFECYKAFAQADVAISIASWPRRSSSKAGNDAPHYSRRTRSRTGTGTVGLRRSRSKGHLEPAWSQRCSHALATVSEDDPPRGLPESGEGLARLLGVATHEVVPARRAERRAACGRESRVLCGSC